MDTIRFRSPISEEELSYCLEEYSKTVKEALYHSDTALKNLKLAYKNPYTIFRVILYNGIRVGWFLARISNTSEHTNIKSINQIYYYCNTSGYKSVRCVKETFKYLEQEAVNRKIRVLTATNSPYDERLQLVKILEKQGWKRYSYYAIKQL